MVYRDRHTYTYKICGFIKKLRFISHLVYFVRTTTMSRLTCGRWDASMLSCCKCWIQSQICGAGGHFDVQCCMCHPIFQLTPRKALIMRTLHSFFCVRTAVLSLFSDKHGNVDHEKTPGRIVVRSSLDLRAIRSLQTGSIGKIHVSIRVFVGNYINQCWIGWNLMLFIHMIFVSRSTKQNTLPM